MASIYNIKILVSYHKPSVLLKTDIFTPIHVGRSLQKRFSKDGLIQETDLSWLENNMIADNTGENISHKNREYCELTSIYWAWKNQAQLDYPDYIGFMHYRRHLCFDLENQETVNQYGLLELEQLDQNYIHKYHLNDIDVRNLVENYDVVTVEATDMTKLGSINNYDHYKFSSPYLHINDYDVTINILKKLYPEYKDSIKKYNQSSLGYYTNIFIFKKDLFNQYAQWLFSILDQVEQQIDIAAYNVQEARVFGYLSEWLFGIWYTHLQSLGTYKYIDLKRTLVKNTEITNQSTSLYPAFKNNNIAICLATDKNYVNYLAVTIQSLISHASSVNNYDINIIYSELTDYQKKSILNMIHDKSNFSIRFININHFLSANKKEKISLFESGHITVASYYRLFTSLIFKQYKKLAYLDCDLVVNQDIANFFNHELKEKTLAGVVKDTELIRWYHSDEHISQYIDKKLEFQNVMTYFNAGVLLLNIQQMNLENTFDKFMDILVNQLDGEPKFHDQDILNKAFENRTTFLDLRWNVLYHIPIFSPNWQEQMPASLLYPYIESRAEPYIVHFAGCIKPWQDANKEMSEYFWHYARMSDFYEKILYANIMNICQKTTNIIIRDPYSLIKLKYYKYKILSKICIGQRRKHYKHKRNTTKLLLRAYKSA
ncbi:DUF4422 domain-containing protein [Neisseriaceae bacterium ESL0693]|nr:DUF4422 domain-containing protein [Neisseriaceae bacterium ESL0693]